MLPQQQGRLNRSVYYVFSIALAGAMLATPLRAIAQDEHHSLAADVAKRVVLDPTTYVPTILAYDSTMRDWNSSQPFFQNGFVEHNPEFTISGLPNNQPLSYEAGRQRIAGDIIANLEISLVNNVTDGVVEHVLIERYPNHRKLVRAIGWVEKGVFASVLSYQLSASHYRQWQANERLAQQLGIQ